MPHHSSSVGVTPTTPTKPLHSLLSEEVIVPGTPIIAPGLTTSVGFTSDVPDVVLTGADTSSVCSASAESSSPSVGSGGTASALSSPRGQTELAQPTDNKTENDTASCDLAQVIGDQEDESAAGQCGPSKETAAEEPDEAAIAAAKAAALEAARAAARVKASAAREAEIKQMHAFLDDGILPDFGFQDGKAPEAEFCVVKTNLLADATRILEMVLHDYGCHAEFVEKSFGEAISKEEAHAVLDGYLQKNKMIGTLAVKWVRGLGVGGKVTTSFYRNRPELRKFTLWVQEPEPSKDGEPEKRSTILRKYGVEAFAAHELGTHFVRSMNSALQPWATNRAKYGIANSDGEAKRVALQAEEGLASLNTVLHLKDPLMWAPALLYYAACKAEEMNFQGLFAHLKRYLPDRIARYRCCARAKRGVVDNTMPGGFGRDQAYFEGAVAILRQLDTVDFLTLYAGRLSLDQVGRVKRLARTNSLALPSFVRPSDGSKRELFGEYRERLHALAVRNGLYVPKLNVQAARVTTAKPAARVFTAIRPMTGSKATAMARPLTGGKAARGSLATIRSPAVLEKRPATVATSRHVTKSVSRRRADKYSTKSSSSQQKAARAWATSPNKKQAVALRRPGHRPTKSSPPELLSAVGSPASADNPAPNSEVQATSSPQKHRLQTHTGGSRCVKEVLTDKDAEQPKARLLCRSGQTQDAQASSVASSKQISAAAVMSSCDVQLPDKKIPPPKQGAVGCNACDEPVTGTPVSVASMLRARATMADVTGLSQTPIRASGASTPIPRVASTPSPFASLSLHSVRSLPPPLETRMNQAVKRSLVPAKATFGCGHLGMRDGAIWLQETRDGGQSSLPRVGRSISYHPVRTASHSRAVGRWSATRAMGVPGGAAPLLHNVVKTKGLHLRSPIRL